MTCRLPPPLSLIPILHHLHRGKVKQVIYHIIDARTIFLHALMFYHVFAGAVLFVNNGQLSRKYLSPERLRTAGKAPAPVFLGICMLHPLMFFNMS
jgi:hypothetical protein